MNTASAAWILVSSLYVSGCGQAMAQEPLPGIAAGTRIVALDAARLDELCNWVGSRFADHGPAFSSPYPSDYVSFVCADGRSYTYGGLPNCRDDFTNTAASVPDCALTVDTYVAFVDYAIDHCDEPGFDIHRFGGHLGCDP